MPSQLVAAWACTSHPLRHKPCCGSVTLLTDNLTSLCYPTVKLSLPFGGCLISLCSETGLLPSNGLVNRKVKDHPTLLGLSCILIFALQLSAMYLGIKVAPAMRPDMPWNPSQDTRLCLDLHSNRPYAILPAPCHTLPVLPTFCVEVKRCNSLTRAFAFEAAVGLSCRPQLVCPSIFQTTLSLYAHGNVSVRGHKSFGTYPVIPFVPPCITIPEESVDVQFSASRKRAFKARLRELSLDAFVLFRPSRLCALCTSHRGPIVPKLACSNLRPASPVGAWSLRKVPRKVPDLALQVCQPEAQVSQGDGAPNGHEVRVIGAGPLWCPRRSSALSWTGCRPPDCPARGWRWPAGGSAGRPRCMPSSSRIQRPAARRRRSWGPACDRC